jgi:hypothetical protein
MYSLCSIAAGISRRVFALRDTALAKYRAARNAKTKKAIADQFNADIQEMKAREVPTYMAALDYAKAERTRLLPYISASTAAAASGDKRLADAPADQAPSPTKKAKTVDTRPSELMQQ